MTNVKKITILGRGNAGCMSAMHFNFYSDLEIEMRYDSKIAPVPTGQGTTLDFPEALFRNFQSNYLNNFPHTMKTGIMYENFSSNSIFHPFSIGRYALHFEPKQFQDFVCNNLKINFKEIDENVEDYESIDSDYIIDCRGTPSNLDNYIELVNPLNCALLATLPKKEKDVFYTRSIAHKHGWCFYIPLPDKVSLGYLFNDNITSLKEAETDFKNTFHVEKINKIFPFKQYVAKEPIIKDRIFLNGNKLFFLEPLEATAMATYAQSNRYYFDYMFNKCPKIKTINFIHDYVKKLQDFILWHYANGSIYDSDFWSYGKRLWKNHNKENFEKTIHQISKKSFLEEDSMYAQWHGYSFKNWMEGMSI